MHRFAKPLITATFSLLIFANSNTAQPDSIYRLPAGTRIKLAVDAEVNSKAASVNDTFLAAIVEPVKVRDAIVLPAGTAIEGRITNVTRASGGGRHGSLDVVFETLRISNSTRPIKGEIVTSLGEKPSRSFNFLSVLGGLAAGTAIGAASSSKGALIGAGIGAATGATIAIARRGKEARIKKGQAFEIELKREVVLPVLDY